MKRTGAILAVAALLTTGLAACSGGGDKAYCDQVKAANTNMKNAMDTSSLSSGDFSKLSEGMKKAQDEIKKIADVAPADIKDDWTKVSTAFDKVMPLFDELKGVNLKDPSKIDPAKMQKLEAMGNDMKNVGTEIETAGKAIQTDAKTRCKIDLN